MKARVKATGEIVEVQHDYDFRKSTVVEFYTNIENPKKVFEKEDLEFLNDSEFIDYWTRLEHQAGIAAMQGFWASGMENTYENVAEYSIKQAQDDFMNAFVERHQGCNEFDLVTIAQVFTMAYCLGKNSK